MKVERLKRKQNKSIIGFPAWNHALANLLLKRVDPAPATLQFAAQIVLTSAFFHSSVYARFNWALHCGLQGLLHRAAIDKRDQSDWVKKK